ncbi:MAG: pilin [Patescibacteria group bacterium]|nr:pilin [Patescibacteria group bacterium]
MLQQKQLMIEFMKSLYCKFSTLKIFVWLIFFVAVFCIPNIGRAAGPFSEDGWCKAYWDTCEGGTERATDSSLPNNPNGDPNILKQACGGTVNSGCMRGKSTGCVNGATGIVCSSITFCCQKTGGVAAKCATSVVNGCGVSKPDPNTSYECMGVAQESSCTAKGGSFVHNSIDGLSYPSCGSDGCCKIPKCVDVAAGSASTAAKPPTEYKLTNPLGTVSIPVLLGRMIKTFLGIVGGIALLVFVYGGVMWMTARGDSAQVKKGQEALTTAVIGLFIVMFAYTLAGNFVSFLTSEQRDIAAEEGRTAAEAPTVADQNASSIAAQQAAAEQDVQAGQDAVVSAGAASGVNIPPIGGCDSPSLTQDQQKGCATFICTSMPTQEDQAACLQGYAQGTGEDLCDLYKTSAEKNACKAAEAINAAQNFVGSGQSLYNTPNTQAGQTGGQADCKYAVDPDKCSTVGWKTVCNETVFDTGYGSYNNASCATPDSCQAGSILNGNCTDLVSMFSGIPAMQAIIGSNCVKLPITGFGNKCGTGKVCCKKN